MFFVTNNSSMTRCSFSDLKKGEHFVDRYDNMYIKIGHELAYSFVKQRTETISSSTDLYRIDAQCYINKTQIKNIPNGSAYERFYDLFIVMYKNADDTIGVYNIRTGKIKVVKGSLEVKRVDI